MADALSTKLFKERARAVREDCRDTGVPVGLGRSVCAVCGKLVGNTGPTGAFGHVVAVENSPRPNWTNSARNPPAIALQAFIPPSCGGRGRSNSGWSDSLLA